MKAVNIVLSILFSITIIFHSASANIAEENQVLLDQYTSEFLENNDTQIRLTYDLINFYEETLKTKNLKALTPTELDYFFTIVKKLIKNDRERSYLELKARVLSDLNLKSGFFENSQKRTFTLIWAATEMIGQNIFKYVFNPIYKSGKLRRMILSNTNDVELRERKVTQFIKKYHNKKRKKRLKNFLKKFERKKDQINSILDKEIDQYLFEIITTIEKKINIRKESSFKTSTAMFRYYLRSIGDSITIGANDIFSDLSGSFGNAVGKVKWRKGRLKNNQEAIKLIKKTLHPLDILVEKTPFILTDYFIPGHFGHIALYLGTEEQLKEEGLWMHPSITAHHDEISKGKTVLEATRDGVEISSLEKFLNVDEVAILRANKNYELLLGIHKDEVYNRAMAQIGKNYDFNFDVETSDEIVCSELIYQTYYFIDWDLEKTMGRWTISPDNIVKEIFKQDPKMDMVLYIKGYLRKKFKKLSISALRRNLER